MLTIKVSIPNFSEKINISQFVGNSENIGFGCKFYVNDPSLTEADYWFVIENLQCDEETVYIRGENVYFLSAEVVHEKGYYDKSWLQPFLDQFAIIFTCHDIFRNNASYGLPFLPWMINSNHGPSIFGQSTRDVEWLAKNNSVEKTKTLSVFCSSQQLTADHRLRFKFVKAIKDYFGDSLDWYGNGINSVQEKWNGIVPYKYHIVLENQSRNNIVTEKLFDCFLGLAYPIYYGAPNIDKYFNSNSLAQIDIMDLKGSIKTIEGVLEKDEWQRKQAAMIESKNRVLTDYNIFNRISKIAKSNAIVHPDGVKKRLYLKSISRLSQKSLGKRLATRGGIFFENISNRLIELGG